jgi:conjugal transfer pilus assembly protein TraU
MKSPFKRVLATGVLLLSSTAGAVGCSGKFMNPITDICWSCVFPITVFGKAIDKGGQLDTESGPTGVCVCNANIGIPIGFWEPVRQVDITRKPYCLVGLGGVEVGGGGGGLPADTPGYVSKPLVESEQKEAFFHAHYYINPVMYYMELLLDDACIERKGFDIAYLTEADPAWVDDELNNLFNPDAFLYGNIAAVTACSADCIAATVGKPLNALYWCGGCNGQVYPLVGRNLYHTGGVKTSSLLTQRLLAKMHREGIMWSASGKAGMCGYYPQILMDKTQYKYQMTYPVPQTTKIAGQCCQPFGRSTILWEAGKEFPVKGEDFSYLIFRKRDCCQGAIKF